MPTQAQRRIDEHRPRSGQRGSEKGEDPVAEDRNVMSKWWCHVSTSPSTGTNQVPSEDLHPASHDNGERVEHGPCRYAGHHHGYTGAHGTKFSRDFG